MDKLLVKGLVLFLMISLLVEMIGLHKPHGKIELYVNSFKLYGWNDIAQTPKQPNYNELDSGDVSSDESDNNEDVELITTWTQILMILIV